MDNTYWCSLADWCAFFDLVQSEVKRRKEHGRWLNCASPFSSRIVCGECGAFFGSKVWGSNTRYRRIIWRCNAKYPSGQRKGRQCDSPHVTEETIKAAFVEAFNRLVGDKERYIAEYDAILPMLADTASLDKETVKVARERDVLLGRICQHVEGNARDAQDQETYGKEFDGLASQLETAEARLEKIADERQARAARKSRILRFLEELRQVDGLLMEFDETLWNAMVDTVTVYRNGGLKFAFKDGVEVWVGNDRK